MTMRTRSSGLMLPARFTMLVAFLLLALGACASRYSASAPLSSLCYWRGDEPPPPTQFPLRVTAPVTANGIVYVGYQTDASIGISDAVAYHLAALRASDGMLLWQTQDPIGAAALTVAQDTLILSNVRELAALRAADGLLLWRVHRGAYGFGPPPLVLGNGALYAVDNDGIYAVRIADGQLLWQTPPSADRVVIQTEGGYPVMSGPVLGTNAIYIGTLNGPLMALRSDDGSVRWQTFVAHPAGSPSPPTLSSPVALAGDDLYVTASHGLTRMRTSDGAIKGLAPDVPISKYLDPVVLNGNLYFGVTNDSGTAFTLLTSGGKPLWSIPVKGAPASIVALDGNTLYLYGGHFFALRFADGAVLWSKDFNGVVAANAGYVFVSLNGEADRCSPQGNRPTQIQAFHGGNGSAAWTHSFAATP